MIFTAPRPAMPVYRPAWRPPLTPRWLRFTQQLSGGWPSFRGAALGRVGILLLRCMGVRPCVVVRVKIRVRWSWQSRKASEMCFTEVRLELRGETQLDAAGVSGRWGNVLEAGKGMSVRDGGRLRAALPDRARSARSPAFGLPCTTLQPLEKLARSSSTEQVMKYIWKSWEGAGARWEDDTRPGHGWSQW